MDDLVYADDVTIICPSIRGMIKMLEIYNTFSGSNHIYFNTRKAICINLLRKKWSTKNVYIHAYIHCYLYYNRTYNHCTTQIVISKTRIMFSLLFGNFDQE